MGLLTSRTKNLWQECRVSWLYIIDGPYFISTWWTIVRFILSAVDGPYEWDGMLLDGWSLSVTVSLLLGNILLLHHMRRRHQGLLRCSILLAWVQCLCLFFILILEKFVGEECSHQKLNREGDCIQGGLVWYNHFFRIAVALFFFAAAVAYTSLWSEYEKVLIYISILLPAAESLCVGG